MEPNNVETCHGASLCKRYKEIPHAVRRAEWCGFIVRKINNMIKRICFFIAIALSLNGLCATTYTVTNTNDSGAGSLRQAMTDATGSYIGNHTDRKSVV